MTGRLPGSAWAPFVSDPSDEWLTPPWILDRLGDFDLDPCSPVDRPWPTAAVHLTIEDDGLDASWDGRVWLNPPYSDVARWMARIADHNYGTALVSARTDTAWFFDCVWGRAAAVMFLRGRVAFYRGDGTKDPEERRGHTTGSALVAYGPVDVVLLEHCGLDGHLVHLTVLSREVVVTTVPTRC